MKTMTLNLKDAEMTNDTEATMRKANCSGSDRANSAADPDWFAQADGQMSALFATLEEINDPDCEEAFEALDVALTRARKMKAA